jgi:3-methyl-2-oxobutanoate hydroxymethyltransferase
MVTDAIDIPTIGIGAGRHCDGQVLVYHDLLGLEDRKVPKFVRRYADLRGAATEAVATFVDDVQSGTFPSSEETYHMTDQMNEAFDLYADAAPPAPVAVPPSG